MGRGKVLGAFAVGAILAGTVGYFLGAHKLHSNPEIEVNAVVKTIAAESPVRDFDGKIEDSYLISFGSSPLHNWKFFSRSSDYLRYKQMEHHVSGPSNMLAFITPNDSTIQNMATELKQDCISHERYAQNVLDMIHKELCYDITIDEERDYVKYPLETIIERCGDCEDLAILAASLMKAAELDVVLLHFPGNEKRPGHVAIAVAGDFTGAHVTFNGKKYYYCETTGTHWLSNPSYTRVGELPKNFENIPVDIYLIE